MVEWNGREFGRQSHGLVRVGEEEIRQFLYLGFRDTVTDDGEDNFRWAGGIK